MQNGGKEQSREFLKRRRRRLEQVIILGVWLIWKQHNACAFDGVRPIITNLLKAFNKEHHIWCVGAWYATPRFGSSHRARIA